MKEELKLELEKLSEEVKVDVKGNVITLYAKESKVYPLFNNIGEEMQISENIPQTLLEIKTDIYLKGISGYVGLIVLNNSLDKEGLMLYNNIVLGDTNLNLIVQNLGRKKITILKGQEIAKVVFFPIINLDIKIKEFEVK